MNGKPQPVEYLFEHEMQPTTPGPGSPIGVNVLVPETNRFREMYNITTERDGVHATDIVLFNFTAAHEPSGTRVKLAFWDRGASDVTAHTYRIVAMIKFEGA
ncbi:MAG: hypothetical protein R3D27_14450 [Hyphomicrobiaceae bacterium]